MNNSVSVWFQNLQASDLQPIVGQILDRPTAEVLNWQIRPLSGGASEHRGFSFGVYQVTGTARNASQEMPWSAVVKILGPSPNPNRNDPTNQQYWKREVLAYQSRLLDQLPGELVAPRCYAIQELPDETCYLWLETIHEAEGKWTLEEHQLTARHLGQFNGAYLTGHPLPIPIDWMLPNHLNRGIGRNEVIPPLDKGHLRQFSETNQGRWLSSESIDRILYLGEARPALLTALERLPGCLCHNDAFRRNLMLRPGENGQAKTVAIDWALLGLGHVGQEIGFTIMGDFYALEVAVEQAWELAEAIFAGYSVGLRDAGWPGDLQQARFGYTVTAALYGALNWSLGLSYGLQRPEGRAGFEAWLGHPIAEIIEPYAVIVSFLLDLGDEALALLPSIERIMA